MEWHHLDRRDFLKAAGTAATAAIVGEAGIDYARAVEALGPIPMRTLGRTGLKVTMFGLGGYHAAVHEKEEESIQLIHRALDLGINFYDNADCYQTGRAEERMGKALEGRRKDIYLMTKVDQRDAQGSLLTLEKSLRSFRTDYLDLWQFHAVSSISDLEQIFGPNGAMETALKAKQEGKIRYIGMTGHSDPEVHLAFIKKFDLDTVQMPINVVDYHYKSFRKTVVDEAVKRNIGVIAMKTLSFGNIVSMGVAKAAEAMLWSWSQPISVLISGCDTVERLNYNVYLAKTFKPMPEAEQVALLDRVKPFAGPGVEHHKS